MHVGHIYEYVLCGVHTRDTAQYIYIYQYIYMSIRVYACIALYTMAYHIRCSQTYTHKYKLTLCDSFSAGNISFAHAHTHTHINTQQEFIPLYLLFSFLPTHDSSWLAGRENAISPCLTRDERWLFSGFKGVAIGLVLISTHIYIFSCKIVIPFVQVLFFSFFFNLYKIS